MADSLGAVEDRWRVVMVVIEADGSVVLHAEPTRTAVPCPLCGNLSHANTVATNGVRSICPGAVASCDFGSTAAAGSVTSLLVGARFLPNASPVRWRHMHDVPIARPNCC
jgi:hypothetical protein